MSDEWGYPAPMEDPEARKARLVRDDEARLVPQGNIVEGEMEDGGRAERDSPPSCPFGGGGPAA